MYNEELRAKAEKVFDTICNMFDNREFQYDADLDELTIESGVNGDDIPMPLKFLIKEDNQVVSLFSPLPFDIPEEKRTEIMFCLTVLNDKLIDGSFDFNFLEGKIVFRITSCYIDSSLGEGLFSYMLDVTTQTVDDVNDKLYMVATGVMKYEQFIRAIMEK